MLYILICLEFSRLCSLTLAISNIHKFYISPLTIIRIHYQKLQQCWYYFWIKHDSSNTVCSIRCGHPQQTINNLGLYRAQFPIVETPSLSMLMHLIIKIANRKKAVSYLSHGPALVHSSNHLPSGEISRNTSN